MSIANLTTLQQFHDRLNGNPFVTNPGDDADKEGSALVTLTQGKRYVALVGGHTSGISAFSSVVFDAGGADEVAFSLIPGAAVVWDGALKRCEVWQLNCTSTTGAKQFTITYGETVSTCEFLLIEFDGEDDVGTFVQVVTGTGTGNPAVSFGAFGAADNLMLFFPGFADANGSLTPTESRSELADHNDNERFTLGIHYQNPHGDDTSVNATASSSQEYGAIGIEVKAEAGAAAFAGFLGYAER